MEGEIKAAYTQAVITLIEGSGGVFEISLDNKILFSKRDLIGTETERFPHPREVIGLIESTLS